MTTLDRSLQPIETVAFKKDQRGLLSAAIICLGVFFVGGLLLGAAGLSLFLIAGLASMFGGLGVLIFLCADIIITRLHYPPGGAKQEALEYLAHGSEEERGHHAHAAHQHHEHHPDAHSPPPIQH